MNYTSLYSYSRVRYLCFELVLGACKRFNINTFSYYWALDSKQTFSFSLFLFQLPEAKYWQLNSYFISSMEIDRYFTVFAYHCFLSTKTNPVSSFFICSADVYRLTMPPENNEKINKINYILIREMAYHCSRFHEEYFYWYIPGMSKYEELFLN